MIDGDRTALWETFIEVYGIEAEAKPLFYELPTGAVATKSVGIRSLLRRSNQVEELIRSVCTNEKPTDAYLQSLIGLLVLPRTSISAVNTGKIRTITGIDFNKLSSIPVGRHRNHGVGSLMICNNYASIIHGYLLCGA